MGEISWLLQLVDESSRPGKLGVSVKYCNMVLVGLVIEVPVESIWLLV